LSAVPKVNHLISVLQNAGFHRCSDVESAQ
jgi:hypothetical protein